MRAFLTAALVMLGPALFLAGCLTDLTSEIGASATAWRSGDLVLIPAGCHELEDALAVYERKLTVVNERLVAEGRCVFEGGAVWPARLVEWQAGPIPNPSGAPGSVWRVETNDGPLYTWVYDLNGPHRPADQAEP